MNEEWKTAPGFHGYEVSDHGNVRAVERTFWTARGKGFWYRRGQHLLTPNESTCGYLKIAPQGRDALVHRLVALAFIPNPEGKPQVNHRNGVKTDNRVENLEWTTALENQKHRREVLGKHSRGERGSKAVLRETDVLDIRSVLAFGADRLALSEAYGVCKSTIDHIATRRNWAHIP